MYKDGQTSYTAGQTFYILGQKVWAEKQLKHLDRRWNTQIGDPNRLKRDLDNETDCF